MVKVSYSWQQLLQSIDTLLLFNVKGRTFKRRSLRQLRRSGGGFIGVVGVVATFFWNWKLLLATVAGVLVMLLVYLIQEWDWQLYWSSLRRLFSGSNRQLTIAVGSGGIATLGTYMIVSIWIDPNSSWIAAGAILQGFGTLTILSLLVWQLLKQQGSPDEMKHDQLLGNLTDTDPLKRLLAVRQLTRWGVDHRLSPSGRRQITDCFCLMLHQEPEAIIRDAILDGLQVLDYNPAINKSAQPLQMPIALQQSETKVPRY